MESFVRLQIQFSGNKLSGGGAYMYIPATLRIVGPSIHTQKNVLERIRKTIFECENKEEMSVEML